MGAIDCVHLSKMSHVSEVEVDQGNIRPALARGREEACGGERQRDEMDKRGCSCVTVYSCEEPLCLLSGGAQLPAAVHR